MQRIGRFGRLGGATAVVALLAFGCAQKSPLEQLEENRSRYSAEANGFFVQETPIEVEMPMGEGDDLDAEVEAAGTGDELVEFEVTPIEVRQDLHLDILLKHNSTEKLPGVTVDISMVDAAQTEKASWRVWIDTSNVERANPTQFSHVIEDVDYVEGDAISVEVRHPVPEAERGDYQEFANVGS